MKLKRHLNILFVSFHLPPGAVRIRALRAPGDRRHRSLQPPDSSCTLKDCYAGTWQPQGTSAATAAAKSLQSCPTLCDPIDGSPTGSPVHGILQAKTLEWVAISFSNTWKLKVKVKSLSRVQLFATPWTAAHRAPPSMGFSRQECWSGVPLPSPKEPL